jgi:hypothetical protein
VQAQVTNHSSLENVSGANLYRDAGLNSILISEDTDGLFIRNNDSVGLPWHSRVRNDSSIVDPKNWTA